MTIHMDQAPDQHRSVIRGGRAIWIVRAVFAAVAAALPVGAIAMLVAEGRLFIALLLVVPIALLLGGAWKEARKALAPSELTVDRDGIWLREATGCRHWAWDDYLGALGRHWISRRSLYSLKVIGDRGGPRWVTIGPFPRELAVILRDAAAKAGRHVPLYPIW